MDNTEKDLQEIIVRTYKKDGAYRVSRGSVDIYVAKRAVNIGSIIDESPIYLCSVGQGTYIPSYNYKDKGYVYWYFIIKCDQEKAELSESETGLTDAEKLSFVEKTPASPFVYDASISAGNEFNDSLMSWYQVEEIRAMNMSGEESADEAAAEHTTAEVVAVDCINELYTYNSGSVYYVKSGSVNIFVGNSYSLEKRKLFCLTTVEQGERIPTFGYRDAGGTKWYFKIAASKSRAELVKLSERSAEEDEKKLLGSASIECSVMGAGQSYNELITEWYNAKSIKPIIDPTAGEKFDISNVSLKPHYIEGNDPVFKAVSYACYKCNIAHHSEEEMLLYCGDKLTVENIAEFSHFICRRIILEDGWWKNDCGPIIGRIDDEPVACVPCGGGKYRIYYSSSDSADDEILTPKTAEKIYPSAYSLGRTLPGKKLTGKDLFEFCRHSINARDVSMVVIFALAGAIIGVLLPTLNQKIYDDYIPLGNYAQLVQICVVISSFMIGNLFFGIVKNISEYRIGSRLGYDLQNATIYRSFYLPEKFFREFDSADIAQRILQIDEIAAVYTNLFVISGLAFIFAFAYLFKMFSYTSKLSWAALGMLAVYAALLYFMSISTLKREKNIIRANGEANSRVYQYLCAIDKIRMAGAEERAAQKYIMPIREQETAKIKRGRILSLSESLKAVGITVFSMILYYVIVNKKLDLSIGNFTAFNAAFGAFSSALLSVVDGISEVYRMKPSVERIMPIYEVRPEYAAEENKNHQTISMLTGRIKLEDLSFAYSEGGPMVLKGLNMSIEPGDYVGIVGKSGCGKSTLFKLLLGFETPTAGKIMVDGKNLAEIDKKSYRRKLGVVLQNGKLINGSIQENITITAPNAKLQDVKEVIKAVGLEDDIKHMPMGINTMLNENSGTISGGQQQRILIARALIGNPSVILLDEATSALDNITQKAVCDTLDGINATKIVIAHRLSTIQKCNKIFVLDGGKVIETGSYKELMEKKGLFAEMAARQLVNGDTDDD